MKGRQMENEEKIYKNSYRLNKRFSEGRKVYYVWYNPDLGQFLVIDHFYRERYDKYNIMLCASYEEAIAFAFCMNKSLLSPIKDRKKTLNHLEELNEDEKLDRDAQAE